jgi:predicted  nucleic acid-binding Zn-ribbon protein
MIDQIFLKEALKIRFKWLKLSENHRNTEKELLKIKKEMEEVFSEYKNKFLQHEPSKKPSAMMLAEINELYNTLQAKTEQLDLKIKPYQDGMDEMKLESDRLWDTIQQKYPNMTLEEIQNEVWTYIKLNLSSMNIKI